MEALFVDTHVLMWLYAGLVERFSPKVRESLESSHVLVCPVSLLEIDYLFEVGRYKTASGAVLSFLQQKHDFSVPDDSFADVVEGAKKLSWTRDPFDRLLVAHARFKDLPLITKDHKIREHYSKSIW